MPSSAKHRAPLSGDLWSWVLYCGWTSHPLSVSSGLSPPSLLTASSRGFADDACPAEHYPACNSKARPQEGPYLVPCLDISQEKSAGGVLLLAPQFSPCQALTPYFFILEGSSCRGFEDCLLLMCISKALVLEHSQQVHLGRRWKSSVQEEERIGPREPGFWETLSTQPHFFLVLSPTPGLSHISVFSKDVELLALRSQRTTATDFRVSSGCPSSHGTCSCLAG